MSVERLVSTNQTSMLLVNVRYILSKYIIDKVVDSSIFTAAPAMVVTVCHQFIIVC